MKMRSQAFMLVLSIFLKYNKQNECFRESAMNSIEAIKARRSVRTYTGKAISAAHQDGIRAELEKQSTEHGVRLVFLQNNFNGKQFGTYGIIKNAASYIACVCENDKSSLLRAGMALERTVIHCTALGIGTCWLGGTFSRDEFASEVLVADGEVIPAVIATGYPSEREGLIGGLLRMGAKSKTRVPFENLFFGSDFSHPLSQDNPFASALEMVRIGPSASNKQPWRAVAEEKCCHLFLEHTPAYATKYAFDMQLLDLGIAMSHLELAMAAEGKAGTWQTLERDFGAKPANTEYIVSWV